VSEKILVSITALENPNLLDTIKECLSNAEAPENISFAISLQYEQIPDLSQIKNKIKTIQYSPNLDNSKTPGTLKIRAKLSKIVENEDYFLQIDSYTKFLKGWDKSLVSDLKELMLENKKTIISNDLVEKNKAPNYNIVADIYLFNNYYYQFDDYSLTEGHNPYIDEVGWLTKTRLINQKYFNNYYVFGNFLFASTEYLKDIQLPDYHNEAFGNLELSVVTYCNGYDVASPTFNNMVLFKKQNEKDLDIKNPRWWVVFDNKPIKKTAFDDKVMFLEVCNLILYGKNSFVSLENLSRKVEDFYAEIGAEHSFKKQLEIHNQKYGENPFINAKGLYQKHSDDEEDLDLSLIYHHEEMPPKNISLQTVRNHWFRIGLSKHLRSIAPASDLPQKNLKESHFLFSGCSITAGDGLEKEDTWSHKLYEKLKRDYDLSDETFFNVARSGNSITESIDQVFKYCHDFGNPKAIFMLLPNVGRDLKYVSEQKSFQGVEEKDIFRHVDAINTLVYKSYFYLDMFCKASGIILISASWAKKFAKLDTQFPITKKKTKADGLTIVPGWRGQLNAAGDDLNFSLDLLSDFESFHFYEEEFMNSQVLDYHSQKKYYQKKYSLLAKDGHHPGSSFHDVWADIFYKKYKEIDSN
jgi:hypothetical protein